MQNFEILFYSKADGTEPAKAFLDSLDVKMRAKMLRTITLLQDNGYELREPYSKPLRNGIFELRAKVGNDTSRVLYFFVINKKIILTNGFVKKTQRTPEEEIARAERYRADYLEREENEHGHKLQ
jgi:phage-related protein